MDLQNILFLRSRRSSGKSLKPTNAFHSTVYSSRLYPPGCSFFGAGTGRTARASLLALEEQKITLGGSQRSLSYRHCKALCVYDTYSHIKLMTKRLVTEARTSKWQKCATTAFLSWGKQQELSVLARKPVDLRSIFLSQEKTQAPASQKA